MQSLHFITTPDELEKYTADLRSRPEPRVALDLEGDQGTVRYHYSISILQCWDGHQPVIIDVMRIGNHPAVRGFLSDTAIRKVMFSAANDVFMAQNCLGCTIENIRDIAIAEKLLGLPINLASYIGIEKEKKDAFQRANWLARPIRPELAEYAINDVLELLKLEDRFLDELREKGFEDRYRMGCADISRTDYRVDQLVLYRDRFPGYRRLPAKKKELAKLAWIAREMIGERLDIPVGYLLSKKVLPAVIEEEEEFTDRLLSELNRNRRGPKKLTREFVDGAVAKARNYIEQK